MIGKIYKRLSAIALATLMFVPAVRAEKISKHTVEGEEMWYWSTTVSVKRDEAHTFWIKDLTETTAIYGASISGVYTWKEDGETYEDYVDVSETADLENAKGGYDHYSLFSADTWDYLPDTVKTITFYVYVEGWGEDASAADISFTFGHASGKAYPFVKPVVTFNANGGTCDESQREVATGETVGSLPYAEKKNADFLGWYTAKTGGSAVTDDTVVTKDVTYYAHWFDYKTVTVTVGGGYASDPETGDSVTSVTTLSGNYSGLSFDWEKIRDAQGNDVGAFQKWVVEPATADLGDEFDPYSTDTTIMVPDVNVKITAQYIPVVAAYVTYELNTEGSAEENAYFYWSPDGGKTLLDSGYALPLAAGTVTVSFYAKDDEGSASAAWKAPASVKVTIPARESWTETYIDEDTGKKAKATYYGEASYLNYREWFVAADGAKQVSFNANGGKCDVSSRWYLDGGTYYALPTPAERKGYVFDGWGTTKAAQCCGLGRVTEGGTVDFSVLDSKKPTLYAQWLKAYDLTLTGTDVTAEYEGTTYTKSVSVLEGGQVILRAPDGYTDAKDDAYLFQCWTPSKAYDFGDGYSASSCETTIEMPAAKLTMTATYVKESEAAWMTMYASGETVQAGDVTIEADTSKFYWSTDGKSWFQSGTQALVKKGTYTVQWKSTSDVWTAPTTKTKVTVAAGDQYDNGEDPAVFTFATTVSATPVVYADGEWYESSEGGTVTMKPTDGRIPTGKTITLTAKAAKGYAFAGWQFEKDWDECGLNIYSTSATVPFAAYDYLYQYIDSDDLKVHIQAVFRPISDYAQEDMTCVFQYVYSGSRTINPEYDEEGYSGSVGEVRVGLNCATYVYLGCSSAASPLAFNLSGTLPKGLKFDTSNGYLSGTPTAAGTYPITVTATDPAGHKATLAISLVVRSVFEPIVGDWRALLTDESGAYAGLLEMSITDKGKASAKVITASGTTSVTPSVVWTEDEDDPEADGTFSIYCAKDSGNEKSGTYMYFSADPSEGTVSYETSTWKNYETTASAALSGNLVRANSAWFKDEEFAAAFLGKYYTVQLLAREGESGEGYRTPSELLASGYLTLTTDKKGTVKVAGKLPDGEKISASAVLLPSEDGDSASALVFVVPSGYKKKGSVALQLDFTPTDDYVDATASSRQVTVTSSVGSWTTPPLLDAISGWDSDDEIFLPGLLSLSANGALYSKLDDLTNYYLSLAVSTGESTPTLEYSYTDSEKTKYCERAEAVTDVEYYLSSDSDPAMLTGGKGGKITVGKSASPWKDSEGYYHYDETKEDRDGNTQPIMNPGGLTISYKSATGIFSGKFNLFFDYEVPQYKNGEEIDPKLEHKSVSCSYEGVLINNGSTYGVGSAVYSGKYTYEYWVYNAKTDTEKAATKTYTQKFALPVEWSLEAGVSD